MRSALRDSVDVLATAGDGHAALDLIVDLKPDVVVLDLEMPGLNGLEVTRALMQNGASPAVVICSVHSDRDLIESALAAGALAYVQKSRCARDLLAAVQAAARGERFNIDG